MTQKNFTQIVLHIEPYGEAHDVAGRILVN